MFKIHSHVNVILWHYSWCFANQEKSIRKYFGPGKTNRFFFFKPKKQMSGLPEAPEIFGTIKQAEKNANSI